MPEATSARRPDLLGRVLEGNRRAIGRVISCIENQPREVEPLLRRLFRHGGKAYVVGLTGPPGAGKSTIADELIRVIRGEGMKVGVLAVDPNSPFSGGAILGDRVRMMRHSDDEGVFIRSMGARGHLGGLAVGSLNAVLVLDATGVDIVIIETVGVGQSELEVAGVADTAVVVIPPGQGDGVQAIKAGIMEIADIFVVNKADHPQAERTVADIHDLLRMDIAPREWTPPIVTSIATQNQGIQDLWIRIKQHRRAQTVSGRLEVRRRQRVEREIVDIAEQRLREQVLVPQVGTEKFSDALDSVMARRSDPYEAADQLASAGVGGR